MKKLLLTLIICGALVFPGIVSADPIAPGGIFGTTKNPLFDYSQHQKLWVGPSDPTSIWATMDLGGIMTQGGGGTGIIYFGSIGHYIYFDGTDFILIDPIKTTTGKFTGLTDGYIPYHQSDALGLVNSPLYTDGTNISLPASRYFNWGTTLGTSGYGVRDNAGIIEYKNSGGSWTAMAGAANNQIFQGISWDESADTYTRTGNLTGQTLGVSPGNSLLPVHASMRRCVFADAGTVAYYLSSTDSTKKEDGVTASVLDGTDGQVMVEVPKFWYRHRYIGTTHYWEISPTYYPGFSVHPAFIKDGAEVNARYIGAYEGVLYDTSRTAYTNGIYQTAVSAVFATADDSITIASRSGWASTLAVGDKLVVSGTVSNNATVTVASILSGTAITVSENLTDETAASTVIQTEKNWTATTGDKLSSVSGFAPITYGTRANFRVAASNRGTGWRQLDYDLHSAIQLLYLVEYGSFYSQSVIGAGITAVTDWAAYNDSNPLAKTGNSNSIGDATGNNAGSASAATESTKYLSYRGIENWWGHIWKWTDGVNINSNQVYVTNTASAWADDTATGYTSIGTAHNADGWQSTLLNISRGFLPKAVGASSSTKITDYYWRDSGWRVVRVGGSAANGWYAGAFGLNALDGSGGAAQYFGGRLAY